MTKNIAIAGLVGLALLSSLIWFVRSLTGSSAPVSQPVGAASGPSHFTVESFLQGITAGQRDQFAVSRDGVITHSGVDTLTVSYTYTATSGTVVAVPNPFGTAGLASTFSPGNATTSVLSAICQTTANPLTGAVTFDLSTSSSAFASSSPAFISARSIGSGALDTAFWRPNVATSSAAQTTILTPMSWSTNRDGTSPYVLAPAEYLTWKIASGTPGTFPGGYLSGTCQATFQKP